MRGTSPMDRSPIQTAWVAGVLPVEVQRSPKRHVRPVAGTKAGSGEADKRFGPTCRDALEGLRRFFTDNPDEELSVLDIGVKFSLAYPEAHKVMARLRDEGGIVYRLEGRARIYRKAP